MAVYRYIAIDASGTVLRNNCEAVSKAAVQAALKEMGYTVRSIRPKVRNAFFMALNELLEKMKES